MRKVDDVNAEDRRRRVLRAAMECFAELGLQKASMKDICKRSNMRSGHIYYYFKSKDEIIEASFRLGLDDMLERLERMLDGDDVLQAIARIPREAESARREWNITPALRLEFCAETVRNERLRQLHDDWVEQVMEAKRKAARKAIKAGRLSPAVDPAEFARAIALLWNGLAVVRVMSEDEIQTYETTIVGLLKQWFVPDASATRRKTLHLTAGRSGAQPAQ
jgi:AcrR family transcriptional regulator